MNIAVQCTLSINYIVARPGTLNNATEQRFEKLIKDILAEEAKQVEQTD